MTRKILIALLFASTASAGTSSPIGKVFDEYCARCHDGGSDRSDVVMDPAHIAKDPVLWSRAERHMLAGTMPPVNAKRPDRQQNEKAIAALEQALNAAPPVIDNSQNIAARLAKLLWNATPDAALLQAAQRNQLRDPKTLEREVRRMLADPRAEQFVSRFFAAWLQLEKLDKAEPDLRFFPDYDPSLRDSMRRETELFLLSQLRGDKDPVELWTANYTFVNEQLARHYGIAGVTGPQFRQVTLPTPERAGLLGQGSILMITTRHQHKIESAYTSPAARATFVLTRFLGVPTPTAFPGAQPVSPDLPITGQTRKLPVNPCMNCHRNFFPLGYALENFDGVGRWRSDDQIEPVNASGAMVDGTAFNGPVELRNALMQQTDAFRTAITERLLLHLAGGTSLIDYKSLIEGSPQTLAAARRILRDNKQIRWSTLIAATVRLQPVSLD